MNLPDFRFWIVLAAAFTVALGAGAQASKGSRTSINDGRSKGRELPADDKARARTPVKVPRAQNVPQKTPRAVVQPQPVQKPVPVRRETQSQPARQAPERQYQPAPVRKAPVRQTQPVPSRQQQQPLPAPPQVQYRRPANYAPQTQPAPRSTVKYNPMPKASSKVPSPSRNEQAPDSNTSRSYADKQKKYR